MGNQMMGYASLHPSYKKALPLFALKYQTPRFKTRTHIFNVEIEKNIAI